jgi:hypothetical protein
MAPRPRTRRSAPVAPMDRRRMGRAAVALIGVAWLIGGCGSSSPAVRSVTHPSSAPARTGAVYADCASATFLAADFLDKAVRSTNPADMNNVTRQGERQAAAALDQGMTRIDALPASERRTSEGAHLKQEMDKNAQPA